MRIAIVFLLVALALSAQTTGFAPIIRGNPVPASVRRYLELTPEQVAQLQQLDAGLTRFRWFKFTRNLTVSWEIEQLQRAETLDPMGLGLRYLELEAIRREVEAVLKSTISEAEKLLSPAQRIRLAALAEVLKTYGTACDAVSVNLLELSQPQQGGLVLLPTPSFPQFPLAASTCPGYPSGFIGFGLAGNAAGAPDTRSDSMRR